MHRRKILIAFTALAAALVALLAQPTLSYYSVLGEATSVITTGDISCTIKEMMGDSVFPLEGVSVKPGSIISKKVTVENTGNNPFWLRVKLKTSVDGSVISEELLEMDINDTDWTLGQDGYYYYNRVVEPGEETAQLFSQVKVSDSADSSYLGKAVKLTVCAFAVQSEYNDASSPLAVAGWPAER